MPDGEESHWLSHKELSDALGCTPNAARMHAVRQHEFVEQAIELLREQLGVTNQRSDDEKARADRAEQRADDERNRADRERDRADRVEQQLTAVEVQLVTARAEVAGLRCQLSQAPPKPPCRCAPWGCPGRPSD